MANTLDPNRRLHRIIGKYRLLRSFCPRCNSDAPAVYKCSVCKQIYEGDAKITTQNIRQYYPVNLATKALWWYSWMHPYFKSTQQEWDCKQIQNCPIIEQTGDGIPCGRCWFYLPDGKTCPRHGDVSTEIELFALEEKLTLEKDMRVKRV